LIFSGLSSLTSASSVASAFLELPVPQRSLR